MPSAPTVLPIGLDWLGGDRSRLRSALEIARPFLQRPLPPLAQQSQQPLSPAGASAGSVTGPVTEPVSRLQSLEGVPAQPNRDLDDILAAVSVLEARVYDEMLRTASPTWVGEAGASADATGSGWVVASTGARAGEAIPARPAYDRDDAMVRARGAAADASQALLRAASSHRRHRRLGDIVSKSLVHLGALATCLPEGGAAASPNALVLARADTKGFDAAPGAGGYDGSGVSEAPALLAQAALALDVSMRAAVRHRGLVCAEEAEMLSALWKATGPAMSPVVQRRVDAFSIARVDRELLRAAEEERRRAELEDIEHMVITATALDVRCMRLGLGVSRRAPAALADDVRARCMTVLGWAAALLARTRRVLASVAAHDADASAIIGRTGSLRLDGGAAWAAVRDTGRVTTTSDAAAAAEQLQHRRLSGIPEQDESATRHAQKHHHHHHKHHRGSSGAQRRGSGAAADPLDAIDAALGDDIDGHVTELDGNDPEAAALRAQRRARVAVSTAIQLALGDDAADSFPFSESPSAEVEEATEDVAQAEAGRLVRLHSQRFAERSAAVQARVAAFRSSTSLPHDSARPEGSVRSGSSWHLTARSTTDLYQEVLRDFGRGGTKGGGSSGSAGAIAAAEAEEKQRLLADAQAASAARAALAAAEASVAAHHLARLEPKRSALRSGAPAGGDTGALSAVLSSRRVTGGVLFAPGGAVDIDADIAAHPHRRCVPPPYSESFETPQAREAREFVEGAAGLKRARVVRRRFRAAGLNARREAARASLDALKLATAATTSPAALLALVASLRAASGELYTETERLQKELGRGHQIGQAGASVTHAVYAARLEARRLLIERHLGLPSGARRTRHGSIDHAPLAVDRPLSPRAPAAEDAEPGASEPGAAAVSRPPTASATGTAEGGLTSLAASATGTTAAADGSTDVGGEASPVAAAVAPAPPPPFPLSIALGRRSSLPICRELSSSAPSPAFLAHVASTLAASRRPPTRQPTPPPTPVEPLPRTPTPLLVEDGGSEEDVNIHANESPEHAPTPLRQTRAGSEATPSPVRPGTRGTRKPQTPAAAAEGPPGTASTGMRPTTQASMRTPRLTEDGEVTEWGNTLPAAAAPVEGDPPPSTRPAATASVSTPPSLQQGSARPPRSVRPPTGVPKAAVPLTREGGRNARVARSRASLAVLLQVGGPRRV